MPDLAEFGNSLDGELFSPDSPGYEAIRRPVNPACREVCPRLVVRCRSVSDVVGAVRVFDGFKLSEPNARFFDAIAARVGAAVAGRTTYEHSGHWGGGGPHPTAPLFVLSHRPAPEISKAQTLVTTGIDDAIAAARAAAGDKDVALMGGGVLTSALEAGLVDEVILHQVPVLLGAGRSFFHELPEHVQLRLLEVIPAPGVTHLHYEVVR